MQNHMKPFAIIEFPKDKKYSLLRDFIASLILAGLSLIIIKTRVDIRDIFKTRKTRLFISCSYAVYEINSVEQIDEGLKYLLSLPLWHKPIFHILIGNKELPVKIKDSLNARKSSIETLEEDAKKYVQAYVEPLDNDFVLFGSEQVRDIIAKNFPNSIQR